MVRDRLRSRHADKFMRRALLTLIALPSAYIAAALIGSLVQRNPNWQEPSGGVLIFVRSNGVHADLVLPAEAAGIDLYRLVPPGHAPDAGAAKGWIAFGWGQREFYLETPRWADLKLRNAARAVFGGDALMHVEHLPRPSPDQNITPLRLDPGSYAKLVNAVAGGFAIHDHQPVPLLGRGYGSNDVFYEATGQYNAFRTSNQWTADRLAHAGVRIGMWTPFAQGVMWRLRRVESEHEL